jgi:anti-sigma-K factor RskA
MTNGDPMSSDHTKWSEDAAAYALGALEPEEAEAFRRHMAECVICRDEAREFQGVANALPLASPQHGVPSGLRRRGRRAVRADPRPGDTPGVAATPRGPVPRFSGLPRPAAWAGALAALAVVVVAGVLIFSGGGPAGVRVYQARVGQAELRVSASHGDLVVRRLAPPPAGRIYEMWIVHGSHAPSPSTLFSVTSGGTAEVGVPGSLDGVSAVRVTQERAGGSLAPTSAPVIVTELG